MDKRLTPYLLRQVLALPVADRITLRTAIDRSFNGTPTPSERLAYLAGRMEKVSGVDFRERSRSRELVTARWIFAFVARREGFPQSVIGRAIGLDHSTVSHAEKRMQDVFAYPDQYRQEISLYNKYIESL